jgi:hypothetical protein
MGDGPNTLPKYPGPIIRVVLIHADGSEEILPPEGKRLIEFSASVG